MWYGPAPYIPQPPPDPPELPEGASAWPRWPWWYGPAAFLIAQIGGLLVGAVIYGIAGSDDIDDPAPLIVAVAALDAILVGTAILFAARRGRPKPADFGFRRTRFWPALGWSTLAFVTFLLFAAMYTQLVGESDQTTLDDLGAKESDVALVTGAILVIIVAPFVEEFFFRGFFYRALRSRLGIAVSALVGGGVFGLVHAPTGLEAVPVLAMLGVLFCLVYERTGSLYPVIALHAFNNSIAYGVGAGAGWLAAGVGFAVIAACVLLPWRTRIGGRAAAPAAAPAR